MRKRSWISISALFVSLTQAACSDDSDGPSVSIDAGLDATVASDAGSSPDAGDLSVTLRFKAKVGSEDLVCGQTYLNQGSSKVSITPQDFRLFVQDVRLIDRSGREVPLQLAERLPYQSQGVALLDFTDGSGGCTSGDPGTNMIITGTVPAGDYTGLVFVNGVPESLNHQDPTLAPAPLQAPGVSWGWTYGYRFLMAEVRALAGLDGGLLSPSDAGALADGGLATSLPGVGLMHLGSTGCTGTEATGITCTNANRDPIRLTGFNPASNTVVADLGAVFSDEDLSTDVQCHGAGDACGPMFEALGLDVATGAPLPTQRVYRVE